LTGFGHSAGGKPFFVMEFVVGEPLTDVPAT
jgi:hypothetical protein